ncbi:MAG: hypothetical protein ABR521_14305 [Gaiellaceae bacterium]
MERVGEHPVPAGPLAVRWLAREGITFRAGALHHLRVALENAGSAAWRDVRLSYHWLDPLGNPVLWDGLRTSLPGTAPGGRLEAQAEIRAPMPPGRYRLALDLVLEHRYWFGEVGNAPLELELDVEPRIERRLAAVGAQPLQEEPLVPLEEAHAVAHLAPGISPAPDWSRRVLDAHQEGHALVGGSIEAGRHRGLAPWRPGTGRNPGFPHPLLCPSVVTGIEPEWLDPVEGLPAAVAPGDEPWVYDGRIVLRLRR